MPPIDKPAPPPPPPRPKVQPQQATRKPQPKAPPAKTQDKPEASKPRNTFSQPLNDKPPVTLNPKVPDASVSVEGNAGAEGSTHIKGKEVGFKFSGGVFASAQTSVSKLDEPGAGGKKVITITNKVGVQGSGSVDAGRFGVDAGFKKGVTRQYQAVVTPEQLQKIRAGGEPPSPYSPDKMPPGTSITMKSGSFSESSLGGKVNGAYGGVSYEGSVTVQKDQAASVKKLASNKVQISIGPEKEIENENTLGVNALGISASFTTSDNSTSSQMHQVTLDLNNPKARDVYAHFLQHGELPTKDDAKAGVTDAATVKKLDISYQQATSLGIGPVSFGSKGPEQTYSGAEVKYADGRSKMSVDQNSGDGYRSTWIVSKDKNGKVTDNSVDIHQDKTSLPQIWAAAAGNYRNPESGSLDIHMSQSQLDQLQQRVRTLDEAYNKKEGVTTGDPYISELRDLKGVNDLEWAFRSNNTSRQEDIAGAIMTVNRYSQASGLPPIDTGIQFHPT